MKKSLIAMVCFAVVMLVASGAMAYTGTYTPGDGINGTPHDLPLNVNGLTYSAGDSLNRICIYCHAPHNTYRLADTIAVGANVAAGSGPQANSDYDYLPLWNHTLPAITPVFDTYDNGNGPEVGWKNAQSEVLTTAPGNVSLLCLSCHDGSIAVNSYGNTSQPATSRATGSAMISTSYTIGQGNYLGNHHPIGFDYDAVQAADGEIRAADGTVYVTDGRDIRQFLAGDAKMECSTCHSVHNTGNSGESFLWRSDVASELCLTCHDKGTYTAP